MICVEEKKYLLWPFFFLAQKSKSHEIVYKDNEFQAFKVNPKVIDDRTPR